MSAETLSDPAAVRRERSTGMLRAAGILLLQTRQLSHELATFVRFARQLAETLDKILPAAEVEAMETPRANIHGALECLLNQNLEPVLVNLDELDRLLPVFLRSSEDATP